MLNLLKYFLKSTWLHSAITIQCCNDCHLSVPPSSKFYDCVDDTKLPMLATLKTDGHYLIGFIWRPEQKSIQSEVRIRYGGTHRLLRKKVYKAWKSKDIF